MQRHTTNQCCKWPLQPWPRKSSKSYLTHLQTVAGRIAIEFFSQLIVPFLMQWPSWKDDDAVRHWASFKFLAIWCTLDRSEIEDGETRQKMHFRFWPSFQTEIDVYVLKNSPVTPSCFCPLLLVTEQLLGWFMKTTPSKLIFQKIFRALYEMEKGPKNQLILEIVIFSIWYRINLYCIQGASFQIACIFCCRNLKNFKCALESTFFMDFSFPYMHFPSSCTGMV